MKFSRLRTANFDPIIAETFRKMTYDQFAEFRWAKAAQDKALSDYQDSHG